MKQHPGVWYLGYICPKCHLFQAIVRDPTEGQGPKLSGVSEYLESCESCDWAGRILPADTLRRVGGATP